MAKTTSAMILESFTSDYSTAVHHAQRGDGQWFVRYCERGPFGYRWSAWRMTSYTPDRGRATGRTARLPVAA